MKLATYVDSVQSSVQRILIKELPREVPRLIESEQESEVEGTVRMMKESKCGKGAVTLPSNEYPNGQIKKPETLNGTLQKSSPIKRIFEVSKSVSFDMTVKKVTIPHKWEKLGLNSEENAELKSTGSMNGTAQVVVCDEGETAVEPSKGRVQRTNIEPVSLDFVDDSEQFGLSDFEVDKLLKDVDKEKPESSKDTDMRQKNGIEHSDSGKYS
jgi:hypothetical protein